MFVLVIARHNVTSVVALLIKKTAILFVLLAAENRKRAVRFELTMTGFADQRLIHLGYARRGLGAEGEIRTLEASLEDPNVAGYITPACMKVELLTGLEPATATFEASRSSS